MIKSDDVMKFPNGYHDKKNNIKIGKDTKLEPNAIIQDNVTIGNNCIIAMNATVLKNCTIGDHTIIGTSTLVESNCTIGSWCTIHAMCIIADGIRVGNNVFIGPGFISANTTKLKLAKYGYPNTSNNPKVVSVISDGARIGSNVSMVPGVKIGKNVMIKMSCFIKKDIPANMLVSSNQDVTIKEIKQDG